MKLIIVQGYHHVREYILTQGPMRTTMDDFWAMVWESHSTVIAMLTRLVEDGREKVYQVRLLFGRIFYCDFKILTG